MARLYEGYAWVGVSAQEVGHLRLPGRHGATDGLGAASRCSPPIRERYGHSVHPGDQCSFDIFAQAGRVRRTRPDAPLDPLGGLDVRRVIAAGGSQSAMRLATYLNAIHPLAPVYDGFLLTVWEGKGPRPEEGSIAMGTRTAIRADSTTPVIVVNSEFEAPDLAQVPMHDTDVLRIWEVTGTPHGVARTGDDGPGHDGWVTNRLSYAPVHEAALRCAPSVARRRQGATPQPRIAITPGARPTIARDERGTRSAASVCPELAAPTHEYRGMSFGTGRAPLFGAARPFPDAVLQDLYPDRTAFTERWDAAVDELVASGSLRPEDAPAMKDRAAGFAVPPAADHTG